MPFFAQEYYAYHNRWRDVSTGSKLLFALIMVAATFLSQWQFSLLVSLFFGAGVIFGAKIPYRIWLKAIAVPLLMLMIVAPMLLIGIQREPDNIIIVIHHDEPDKIITVILRAIAITSIFLFIIFTTPTNRIINTLVKLKVPELFIELIVITYRFIFLMTKEAQIISNAQIARGGYTNFRNTIRSSALLASSLLARSLISAKEMELALNSRGYSGKLAVLEPTFVKSNSFAIFSLATFIVSFISLFLFR